MEGEKRARGSKTQSPFALTFKTPRFSNTEKGNKKKKKKKNPRTPIPIPYRLSPLAYALGWVPRWWMPNAHES